MKFVNCFQNVDLHNEIKFVCFKYNSCALHVFSYKRIHFTHLPLRIELREASYTNCKWHFHIKHKLHVYVNLHNSIYYTKQTRQALMNETSLISCCEIADPHHSLPYCDNSLERSLHSCKLCCANSRHRFIVTLISSLWLQWIAISFVEIKLNYC